MAAAHSPTTTLADVVRHFAPGWFAAVMGSGVLSLDTLALASRWPVLEAPAWALHYFNLALFATLLLPWFARCLVHPQLALATLRHPVQASFYPTLPIAMLVIAAQFLAFGPHVGLAVLYTAFAGEQLGLEHVTPANFIPAVGLVVIPIAGAPLVGQLTGAARDLALLLNIVALGAGTLMYLALLALTLQRKYLAKPAFGMLTPTVWIHLAPIGAIPVSLLNLAEQLPFALPQGVLLLVSLLFWGSGVWWLLMATLLTAAAQRRGLLPFALSWWGFTFPLGAFAAASLRLGGATGLAGVDWIGIACWGLLIVVWLATLVGTMRGVASGGLFRPHP